MIYRDNKVYDPKALCSSVENRNNIIMSICYAYVVKKLWNVYEHRLEADILAYECASKAIFSNKTYKEIADEYINDWSSYDICTNANDCWPDEICEQWTKLCEYVWSHMLSETELDEIIKNNEFSSQWCWHSWGCNITSTDWKSYSYKNNINIDAILKKYNKTIESRRTE